MSSKYNIDAINEHIALHHPKHMDSVKKFRDLQDGGGLTYDSSVGQNGFGSAKNGYHSKSNPNDKYITKEFHEQGLNDNPIRQGWAEMASKSLYHAGGLQHLIHDVHMGSDKNRPTVNVNFSPEHIRPYSFAKSLQTYVNLPPQERHKAGVGLNQISTMDYLTGNTDRHNENVLISKQGQPLAIDHGFAFQPTENTPDWNWAGSEYLDPNFRESYLNLNHGTRHQLNTPESYHETADWWLKNRRNLQADFHTFTNKTLNNPQTRDRLTSDFQKRYNVIDRFHSRAYQNLPYIKHELELAKWNNVASRPANWHTEFNWNHE